MREGPTVVTALLGWIMFDIAHTAWPSVTTYLAVVVLGALTVVLIWFLVNAAKRTHPVSRFNRVSVSETLRMGYERGRRSVRKEDVTG